MYKLQDECCENHKKIYVGRKLTTMKKELKMRGIDIAIQRSLFTLPLLAIFLSADDDVFLRIFIAIISTYLIWSWLNAITGGILRGINRYCKQTENPEATMKSLEDAWRDGIALKRSRMDNNFVILYPSGMRTKVIPIADVWDAHMQSINSVDHIFITYKNTKKKYYRAKSCDVFEIAEHIRNILNADNLAKIKAAKEEANPTKRGSISYSLGTDEDIDKRWPIANINELSSALRHLNETNKAEIAIFASPPINGFEAISVARQLGREKKRKPRKDFYHIAAHFYHEGSIGTNVYLKRTETFEEVYEIFENFINKQEAPDVASWGDYDI